MDLGTKGRWALVCGASQSLGWDCAQAPVQEGVNVLVLAPLPGRSERARQAPVFHGTMRRCISKKSTLSLKRQP